MKAEKTQKEVLSRVIQTEPGRGVYMEDNRQEVVGQAKFINTIQKETNYVNPILQRTIIPGTIVDLSNETHVEKLYQEALKSVKFNPLVVGEKLRQVIARKFDHLEATWNELFADILEALDRETMTEVWNAWFTTPPPWDIGDKKEKEEEKAEEKKLPPYKGEKITPHKHFVGVPGAIHIHVIGGNTHLKLGGEGKRIDIHDNNWESDCKKALEALLYSGLSSVEGFDDCLYWLCQEADIDVDAARKMWTQREKKA